MLPILQARWDALERRRAALLAELDLLPPASLAWHPAPDAWSLAQVAEHLVLVERGILHLLVEKADRPSLRPGVLDPLKGAAMRAFFALGGRIRAPTKAILPTAAPMLPEVRAAWDATRARLRGVVDGFGPERLAHRTFRHPIAGPLTIDGTLAFLASHHDHHLRQVARIRAAKGFPARQA